MENLKAPFPYFGGKSKAAPMVWDTFGSDIVNYVEPFAGSAAMLLQSPKIHKVETINDYDGFVANFWRAISKDAESVADYADWPVNENDLFSRHLWIVGNKDSLTTKLHLDPDYYDAKIAGYWVWGLCSWIGSGFCSGNGPWKIVNSEVTKQYGDAGKGVNKQLPHLGDAGKGVNKPTTGSRREFIFDWFLALQTRLRNVRVTSGDWSRVVKDSVTTRHGMTAIFLDPPYDKGNMDYGDGGMGLGVSAAVRSWCVENYKNPKLKLALCGHAGEHDELLELGWFTKTWKAGGGYARTEEARENSKSETIWFSSNCVAEDKEERDWIFD